MTTIAAESNDRARVIPVRKWGNGYGILLPKAFVDELNLKTAEMRTSLRGSAIVLTKARSIKKPKLTLKEMIRGMRPDDRQKLVDFGKPVGREIW